jgi:hypothetical protein
MQGGSSYHSSLLPDSGLQGKAHDRNRELVRLRWHKKPLLKQFIGVESHVLVFYSYAYNAVAACMQHASLPIILTRPHIYIAESHRASQYHLIDLCTMTI